MDDVEQVREQKRRWLAKYSNAGHYGLSGVLADKIATKVSLPDKYDVSQELALIREASNLSVATYNQTHETYLQLLSEGKLDEAGQLMSTLQATAAHMQAQMDRVITSCEKAARIEATHKNIFTKEDLLQVVSEMMAALYEVAKDMPHIITAYERVVEQRVEGLVQKADVAPYDVNEQVALMDSTIPLID